MEYCTEIITFTSWANGGDALGKLADGRIIFAEGGIPGEKAEVRFPQKDTRFVHGEIIRILEESDLRIAPRCPLFGSCSRCQFQFLAYKDQLNAKTGILLDHLCRIGSVKNADSLMKPILPAPEEWNYQTKMELYPDENGRFCVPDKREKPLVLEAYCPVCRIPLNELIPSLDFGEESGIDMLEMRLGDDDEIQLILHGQSEKPETEIENDTEVSLVYSGPTGSYVMSGVSTIRQTRAGITTAISDSSDFSRIPEIEGNLYQTVLPLLEGDELLVINPGTGFLCQPGAERFENVTAFSFDERETEDFVYNLDVFENISLYVGALSETLPNVPRSGKRECMFIEGGMTGLSEDDIRIIALRDPARILYRCDDPAVFSRDIKRFNIQGRALKQVIPFDPAPQTAAVGAVALL